MYIYEKYYVTLIESNFYSSVFNESGLPGDITMFKKVENFQDLILIVPANKERVFIEKLIAKSEESGWECLYGNKKHVSDENDLLFYLNKDNVISRPEIILVQFRNDKIEYLDKTIEVKVTIYKIDGCYDVVISGYKIVHPRVQDAFMKWPDFDELNFIMNKFYMEQLSDIIVELKNIKVVCTKEKSFIFDVIGSEATKAFKWISKNMKDDNSFYPLFIIREWMDFVSLIHKNKTCIQFSDFSQWLEEDGWTKENALKLWSDLQFSLSILLQYDLHNSNVSEKNNDYI